MTAPVDTPPFGLVDLQSHCAPLDRAEHLRGDAAALAPLWSTGKVLALDAEGRARAGVDGALRTRAGAEVDVEPERAVFLGRDGQGTGWFAVEASLPGDDAAWIDLRTAAARCPAHEAAAFATARALLHWRARTRFCGACGGDVEFLRSGWVARCTRCALEHYPRTDAAVIVAVGDGERLLMGRQRAWPARRYSVIAGFVEPGETLEQAVAREVGEETGIEVTGCRYAGSQPWPFPSALMLGFIARAEPAPPRVGDELEDARWFTRGEVEAALAAEAAGRAEEGPFLLPARISIAHWLVRAWLAEHG